MSIGTGSSEEPEIAVDISPCDPFGPASGKVTGSCAAQRSVNAGNRAAGAQHAATAHPGPFTRSRIELPEIIQNAGHIVGVRAVSTKEPERAVLIGPGNCGRAAARRISGSRSAQRAVHSRPVADTTEWATVG